MQASTPEVPARCAAPDPARLKLAQGDLPNLWQPRADQLFHLDALPYLGTGKLGLRKARKLAAARSAEHCHSITRNSEIGPCGLLLYKV